MKLSELVEYLNVLQQDHVNPDYQMAMSKFLALRHLTDNHYLQFSEFSEKLTTAFNTAEHSILKVESLVDELKDKIISTIENLELAQLAETERWYSNEECMVSNSYILQRRMKIDDDSNIFLRARLKCYTDWRLPGMIIRPGLESFIEDLVPLDPLYLVDQDRKLLVPTLKKFNLKYRKRLRPYVVDEFQQENPLCQLPNGQFGFIFAWNFFNYKPIAVVNQYLSDFYQKLRPGGVAIFSFNDCDIAQGARMAEGNFMSYVPARKIKSYAEKIGFDILYHHRRAGDVVWLEIKKPGEIQSIRGGQSLAKIVAHQ